MSSGEFILAIDQGTTGTTCLLVDRSGVIRSRGFAPVTCAYPADGWVEQDARELWKSVLQAASQALGSHKRSLAAIGIANQRETTIVWDSATGEPLAPAIVWQDRRTAAMCRDLDEQGHAGYIRSRTGLVLDPYFSAVKIRWLLESDARLANLANSGRLKFGTVDSWLVWNLTAGKSHVTDLSNASRTMLCDIELAAWSDELLSIFDIPPAVLPEIVPTSGRAAVTADIDGIPAGVPIAGLAGDQHAALFGQACFEPGMLKVTYGTGCFLLANTGGELRRPKSSLLETVAWQIGSETEYAIEGSVFIGGAVVQWLRDDLRIIDSSEDSERLASEVEDTAGVVFVPAFVGLGAPYWNPRARGLIAGLTRKANRAHVARAALESIAHQVADVAETMALETDLVVDDVRVDGGASANNLLMQMQSDLLGVRVLRPTAIETTALGAAFLAGLSTGFWNSKDELRSIWRLDREFAPSRGQDVVRRRRDWRKAVAKSLDWADV